MDNNTPISIIGKTVYVKGYDETDRLLPLPCCPTCLGVVLEHGELKCKVLNSRTGNTRSLPLDEVYLDKEECFKAILAEKARMKLDNFHMSYALGYDEKGNPCAGLRSVESVLVHDSYILVSGDVFLDGKRLYTVEEIGLQTDTSKMEVKVRGQVLLFGKMYFFDIGTWKVSCIESNANSGVLTLEKN